VFKTLDERELEIHMLGHTLDMDIIDYINKNTQTCKVETETGNLMRHILTCPIC